MEQVVIYLTPADRLLSLEGKRIGVDRGAYFLASQGVTMDLAIGDFDSVTAEELAVIRTYASEVLMLHKRKDESDAEAALSFCEHADTIFMIGALGNRMDHSLVNLRLMQRDTRIVLFGAQEKMYVLGEGQYELEPGAYRYLSLFGLEESIVSISGVAYPLDKAYMDQLSTYGLSNEITDAFARLTIHRGRLLISQTNDAPSLQKRS